MPPKAEAPVVASPAVVADRTEDAWAGSQLTAMRQLVRDGKCDAAAKVGLQIRNRNPGFYDRIVATDRLVRGCKATIDTAARKDAERTKAPAATQFEP